ncbi:MAG: zinc ABC transporter substrate-binding protein [Ruminococcaceae bacterium]|nr:zinc ABC transporter substrate-binding protein [Oscillospiraceae bacterium]
MVKFLKITSLVLAIFLFVGVFVGCAGKKDGDGGIKILCSVFPEYDWVRNIVGDADGVEVELLVSNGQELHSYEASPKDIMDIKESDVVISVGGTSDAWISEAIDGSDAKHIKLTKIDGIALREVRAHSSDHEDEHDHEHTEIDEHVWLSLKNAEIIVEYLSEELSALDKNNAEKYKTNAEKYIGELKSLDQRMTNISTEAHTLLFADRFPFVYLLEDYGIGYYAAFEGCSSDISWTPETTVDLASRLDASNEKYLFVTESSDGELAKLVISTSAGGGQTVVLNSMQSVSITAAETTSYVKIMTENVEALERILGD